MKQIETEYKDQSRWNEFYGRNNLVSFQDESQKYLVDPENLPKRKSALLRAIPQIRGKSVLELGSGNGRFSVALAKLGAIVTGVDIGNELVELSIRVAALNQVSCDFRVSSVHDLQFADESFDYVVGNDILHHLPKAGVSESLREAHRVLKPGGMAFFSEPIENSKMFDFLQNLIPVGTPGSPQFRPSIVQRQQWQAYLAQVDDRALSDSQLTVAKGSFRGVTFQYDGLFIRLERLSSSPALSRLLNAMDRVATHKYSPINRFSRSVLAIYKK